MVQWLPTSQILRNKSRSAIKGYCKSETVSPSVQLALCNPMDCNLPDSSVHGIFPGKNTGVGCHFLLQHLVYSRCLISVYFLVQQSASLYSDKIAVCFDECNNQPPVYYTYKTVINAASVLSNFLLLKSESEVAQSCLTLSDPMDCSFPGSSVHGILQARVLEWGAIALSLIMDMNG